MGTNVTPKPFGIAKGALRDLRHMAIDAGDISSHMYFIVLDPGFIVVAAFTLGSRRGQALIPQLDNALMGIVANNAVDSHVFALEQLFILFVVLDKTTGSVYFFGSATHMAVATGLGIAIDKGSERIGVIHM